MYEPFHDDFKPDFYQQKFHSVVNQFASQTMTAPTAGVAHDLTRSGLGPDETDVVARHMRNNPPPSSGPAQPQIPAALDHHRDSIMNTQWENVKNAPWAGVMYDPNQKKYLVNPDHPAPVSHQIGAVLHGILDQAGNWAGNALEHVRETVPAAIAQQMPLLDEGRTAEALINIISDPKYSGERAVHDVANVLGVDPYQLQRSFREAGAVPGTAVSLAASLITSGQKAVQAELPRLAFDTVNTVDNVAHHTLDLLGVTDAYNALGLQPISNEIAGNVQDHIIDAAHNLTTSMRDHAQTGASWPTQLLDKVLEFNILGVKPSGILPGAPIIDALNQRLDTGKLFAGSLGALVGASSDTYSILWWHGAGRPLVGYVSSGIHSGKLDFNQYMHSQFKGARIGDFSIEEFMANIGTTLNNELQSIDPNNVPETWKQAQTQMPTVVTAVDAMNPLYWWGGPKAGLIKGGANIEGIQAGMKAMILSRAADGWTGLADSLKAKILEAKTDLGHFRSDHADITDAITKAHGTAEAGSRVADAAKAGVKLGEDTSLDEATKAKLAKLPAPKVDKDALRAQQETLKQTRGILADTIDGTIAQIKAADPVLRRTLYKNLQGYVEDVRELEAKMSGIRQQLGSPKVDDLQRQVDNMTKLLTDPKQNLEEFKKGASVYETKYDTEKALADAWEKHTAPRMDDILKKLGDLQETVLKQELQTWKPFIEASQRLEALTEGHASDVWSIGQEGLNNLTRAPGASYGTSSNGLINHAVYLWQSGVDITDRLAQRLASHPISDAEGWRHLEDPTTPLWHLAQEDQDAIKAVRAMMAGVAEHLSTRDLVDTLIQNYYPHIIEHGPGGETGEKLQQLLRSADMLNRNSIHFKPRMVDQIIELEKAGYKVKKQMSEAIPQYMRSILHADMVQRIGAALREAHHADGTPAFLDGPSNGHFKGYSWIGKQSGIGFEGFVHNGHYDILRALAQTTADNRNGVTKALDLFNKGYRGLVMYNPFFHTYNQLSSQLQVGSRFGQTAILGKSIAADDALFAQAAREMTMAGNRDIESTVDKIAKMNPMLGEMLKGFQIKPVSNAISGINSASHNFLWKTIVRNGQLGTWWLMRAKAMAAGLEESAAGRGAGWLSERTVGSRSAFYMSNFEKTYLQRSLFAYGWTHKHIATLIEAVGGEHAFMKGYAGQGITPELAEYMTGQLRKNLFQYVMSSIFHTEMANYALNGHFTNDNESGHEFDLEITNVAGALGLNPAGKRIYVRSPFMNFGQWYVTFLQNFMLQDTGPAIVNSILNKTSPLVDTPFTIFSGLAANKIDWTDAINKTVNPWYRTSLSNLDMGAIANEWQNAKRGGPFGLIPQGPATAKELLTVLANTAVGLNAPMYGARKSMKSGGVDAQTAKSLSMILAKEGINPNQATAAQMDAAKKELQDHGGPLGIFSGQYKTELEAYFREDQITAAREAGISEDQIQKNLADGKWLDGIDLLKKHEIYAKHPELKYWRLVTAGSTSNPQMAEAEIETAKYFDDVDRARKASLGNQLDIDQQFKDHKITLQQWKDQRHARLQGLYGYINTHKTDDAYRNAVIDDAQRLDFQTRFGTTPVSAQPEDQAYFDFIKISVDDPKYKRDDGSVDYQAWSNDREKYLSSLPREYVDYIGQLENQNRTPTEQDYYKALDGYHKFTDANAQYEAQYRALFDPGMTAKLRSVYLKEHPDVQQYINGRQAWFDQHPTIAQFFHPLEQDVWQTYKPAVQAQKLAEWYYWYGHGHQDYLTPYELQVIQNPNDYTQGWGPTEQEILNQTYHGLGG